MIQNRSIPGASIIPELGYPDVPAAAKWLSDAFGFRVRLRIGDHRIQMTFGNGAIVVGQHEYLGEATRGASVLVRVDDVDAHYAHARAAGATVAREPETHAFGERQYTVTDIGGHRWTFSQSVADVDPAAWGGELASDA
jgi:uncharacterized glyoxalase superfamily protein PhnB